jgi:hypothetical protein
MSTLGRYYVAKVVECSFLYDLEIAIGLISLVYPVEGKILVESRYPPGLFVFFMRDMFMVWGKFLMFSGKF